MKKRVLIFEEFFGFKIFVEFIFLEKYCFELKVNGERIFLMRFLGGLCLYGNGNYYIRDY